MPYPSQSLAAVPRDPVRAKCKQGERLMLSVAAAQEIVLQHARPLPAVTTSLDASAVGLVLAEDVAADLDLPPFDKALMDGYAVRAADLTDGRAILTVIEEIMAGQMPTRTVEKGQATRLM